VVGVVQQVPVLVLDLVLHLILMLLAVVAAAASAAGPPPLVVAVVVHLDMGVLQVVGSAVKAIQEALVLVMVLVEVEVKPAPVVMEVVMG
jgi:hypothetical protein